MEIGSKTVKIILKRGGERFREEGKTAVKTRKEEYNWIKNGEVGYLLPVPGSFPSLNCQIPRPSLSVLSLSIKYFCWLTKVTFSMPCVISASLKLHSSMADASGLIAILQSRHIPTQSNDNY